MLRKNKFVFLTFFQSVQQVCAAAHAGHTQHLYPIAYERAN